MEKTYEFVGITSRPFFVRELSFDGGSPKEIRERCEREIEDACANHKNPIVRIRLVGTIAGGFGSADMPLQMLINRYSDRAVLDFDSSKLVDTQVERGIAEIRSTKEGGSSVKEMGMAMLLSKLKDEKLDSGMRITDMFNILSSDSKKEKILAEAIELLESPN